MDNFDHKESTTSSIRGSHETILILFQNIKDTGPCNEPLQTRRKHVSNKLKDKRALEHIHISQKLVPHSKYIVRNKINKKYK